MSNVDKHGFCGGKYFGHTFPSCFSGNMSNFGSALILPRCAMTQYHQNPAALPQADTRLSNQSGNFGAAIQDNCSGERTHPQLDFWDSHWEAAKGGMGTFKAGICRDIPNLGAETSLLSWMELFVLPGVGDGDTQAQGLHPNLSEDPTTL